jgi:hypothetical protein
MQWKEKRIYDEPNNKKNCFAHLTRLPLRVGPIE